MKKIKYITCMIFITIIFVLIGDMYIWNVDSFETEYISTTMYKPDNYTQIQMTKDIEKNANDNDCMVFAVNRSIDSVHSETVTIYAMDGVKEVLEENSDIKSGEFKSVFLGSATVNFDKFQNMPENNEINTYYIIGNLENAQKFKSELIDIYDGNFPHEGYTYFNSIGTVSAVWSVGILFLLLMTLYEVVLIKKEVAVRFIYGENLGNIVFKHILSDVLFAAGYSCGIAIILKQVFNMTVDYLYEISLICIIGYCIINSLLYVRMFFMNYQKTLSRAKGDKAVINVSYIYKVVTIVVMVVVMTFSVEMIVKSIDFWKQKDFFEEYDNYSYLSVSSEDDTVETTEAMMLKMLNDKTNENKAFLNTYIGDGIFSNKACLICNNNTVEYLKNNIRELEETEFTNRIYYIVPDTNRDMYVRDLDMYAKMYIQEDVEYEVITYKSKCSVIGIRSENGYISEFYSEPLIILDLRKHIDYFNGIYFSQACMFCISDMEWETYMTNNDIKINTTFKTNVYENYMYNLKSYQRMLLFGAVVLIILLVLETIIIKTMLKYECMVNAVELAIKTVVGYPVLLKYKKMFLSSGITLCISGIVGMIISQILRLNTTQYLLIGYALIALIDVIMMFHYIRKVEKSNINTVIKGRTI